MLPFLVMADLLSHIFQPADQALQLACISPGASRSACAGGEWHGVTVWSELHSLGKERESRKEAE